MSGDYAKAIRKQRLELDWRDKISKGDVLLARSGVLRVARRVQYHRDGFLIGVHLAILHCSWTRRPYTLLNRADLNTQGLIPAGAKATLRSQLDRQLEREFGKDESERRLFCWDTVGVMS